MPKEIQIPESENTEADANAFGFFVIRHSFGIRNSGFVISTPLQRWLIRKLLPCAPRQLPSMRRSVSPMLIGRGLFVAEWFAAHLDINFLHLAGKAIADITRYSFFPLQIGFDRLHRRFHLFWLLSRVFSNLLAQRLKVRLLVLQNFTRPDRAVSRTNDPRAEFLCRFQCLYPFAGVSVTHIVVWAVHTRVAGEQYLFLRQPREGIAVRVRQG